MEKGNNDLLLEPRLKREELENLAPSRRSSLLSDAPPLAARLLRGDIEDQADASIVITNVSQIMAIALGEHDAALFGNGIEALEGIWKEGGYEALYPVRPPAFEASLWERLGIDLYAVGGLTVYAERWLELRQLTTQSPTGGPNEKSWLRQGQVVSARGNEHYPEESILRLAVNRMQSMKTGLSEEEAIRCLAVFDLLSGLVIAEENLRGFYPNAAEFSEQLLEPTIIESLRTVESPIRQQVFPDDTPGLIKALVEYDRTARLQAALARYRGLAWEWRGFADARTLVFLTEEHILEEWTSGA